MKIAILTVPGMLALASMLGAHAEQPLKVGQAEFIRNEVLNIGGAQLIPVKVGDEVVRDETLRTGADSHAKISLTDDTKLSLGPTSTLKIDRAVYSGEKSYREIAIRLTEGTFRFVTGHSEKKSYVIETPTAAIGVRGTVLDIRVQGNQTLVSLQSGQASVCAGGQCTELLKKGHTANVLRNGNAIELRRELTPSWTFASICAGNAGLCGAPLTGNPLKKANLNNLPIGAGKAGRITRYCPDGTPMVGNSCGLSRNALGPLPRLNDTPSATEPIGTRTLDSPLQRGGIGAPSLGAPASVPGISVPGLRR